MLFSPVTFFLTSLLFPQEPGVADRLDLLISSLSQGAELLTAATANDPNSIWQTSHKRAGEKDVLQEALKARANSSAAAPAAATTTNGHGQDSEAADSEDSDSDEDDASMGES